MPRISMSASAALPCPPVSMSALWIAALIRRSVETRRWSRAFIAVFNASLISSRNKGYAFASEAPPRRRRESSTFRPCMNETQPASTLWAEPKVTALLVLADGTVLEGHGFGAAGHAVGEVCFNTAMTGYQEILTDPSYAGQIITFTFPHIGNVGTNDEDIETTTPAARGLVLSAAISEPSSWRATQHLDAWLKSRNLVGIAGVDTRRLTRRIRDGGAPSGVVAHSATGAFDLDALKAKAATWPGLDGMDLAIEVSCRQSYRWEETPWVLGRG